MAVSSIPGLSTIFGSNSNPSNQFLNTFFNNSLQSSVSALGALSGMNGGDVFTSSLGVSGGGLGDVVNSVLFGAPALNNSLIGALSGSSNLAQTLADGGKGKKADILPSLLSSAAGNADLYGGTSKIISSLYSTVHDPKDRTAYKNLSNMLDLDIPINTLMGIKPKKKK